MKSLNDRNEDEVLKEKKVQILEGLVAKVSTEYQDIYYLSTIEVASLVHKKINEDSELNKADQELVNELSPRDIQILLSYHKNS